MLNVKPQSQLFPVPMIMGCEGTVASILLQYNGINVTPKQVMHSIPKHEDNPEKGYVGHAMFVKFGAHQTIFPEVFAEYLRNYDKNIFNGSGTEMKDLERVIDNGQPILLYHTIFKKNASIQRFKVEGKFKRYVSNIHITMLVGYDKTHYYIIDPLWMQLGKVVLPAILPNGHQILKFKKEELTNSYNEAGRMCIFKEA